MAVPVRAVRKTAAGALGLASKGMELGAFATRMLARRLAADGAQRGRPPAAPEPASRRDDEGPGPLRAAEARLAPPTARGRDQAVGRVSPMPTQPVPLVEQHARTFATHAEELASRGAAEVVRAVAGLSTDELRALYEYESANKKRKTVLAAIEAQLAPTA